MTANQVVVLVRPDAQGRIDPDWLDAHLTLIAEAGIEAVVLSRPVSGRSHNSSGPGVLEIEPGSGISGELKAVSSRYPDNAVLILQSGVQLPVSALTTVLQDGHEGQLTSCLSTSDPHLNPLAAWAGTPPTLNEANQRLQSLQPLAWLPLSHWPRHLLQIPAEQVGKLAESGLTAEQALADGLIRIQARTDLLVGCYAPDISRIESALSNAAAHIGLMMKDAATNRRRQQGAERAAATLHISHAWGGGVGRWVRDFCANDTSSRHYTLVASGHPDGGWGSRLTLHPGDGEGARLETWHLTPPIRSVAETHPQYAAILRSLIEDHGIGRIIVSSLVGHALDVFETGLPTLQVLHDLFPAWPLLETPPPGESTDAASLESLQEAMSDHGSGEKLQGRSAAGWLELRQAYVQQIQNRSIHLVAPSNSTRQRFRSLHPALEKTEIQLIPHGVSTWPGAQAVSAHEDHSPLRLVVPGRIQAGKGQQLLLEALPRLNRYAHVYLVGSGKQGETFFGRSGVSIIPQYDHAALPELLGAIQPHAALLLSTVEETFSYTLSEMLTLGIPVIATRKGAFVERLQAAGGGFLIEPDSQALVDQIRKLADTPQSLNRIRERLRDHSAPSLSDMVAAYNSLCPVPEQNVPFNGDATSPAGLAHAHETISLLHDLQEQLVALENQKSLVAERTAWAESARDANQQLQAETDRLNHELLETQRRAQSQLDDLEATVEERTLWARRLESELDSARQSLAVAQDQIGTVLNSRSWRLTAPLRAATRIYRRLRHAGLFNPLRWPSLAARSLSSIRREGLAGSLDRAQSGVDDTSIAPASEPPRAIEPPEQWQPVRIPTTDRPSVSIVIPVFGKVRYTQLCLQSIVDAESEQPYEVIVVDDASPDDTAEFLQQSEGIRVVELSENRGFIAACNAGAETARGEYLVFLNNDTIVPDYWLDQLVESIENLPDAGAVGPRLLFPDGSLQEAGGLVFADGSAWNVGRNRSADNPRYLYAREVDYVSGACLLLRRSVFEELNGFDDHFAPAYYEDTDLAFRLRDAGYRVYVQPQVSVVHIEGVSSGTDESSGMKRFQPINREKFLSRWQDRLAAQPLPGPHPDREPEATQAIEHRLGQRTLLIDAYTPEPDQDSGSVRLVNLMRCLQSLDHHVTFATEQLAYAGDYTRALQKIGIEVLYRPHYPNMTALLKARGAEFDHIIISRHYVAEPLIRLVRRHAPHAHLIFDTVDLHYLREQRLADLESSPSLKLAAARTRRAELAVMRQTDQTWVVSPREVEELATTAPDTEVRVVSNIHPVVPRKTGFAERRDIFFIGGYQHPPNVDAAKWFVRDIWPRIHAELPDLGFHLIGSKAPDQVRALGEVSGVRFHGFVENIEPFLEGCRLAVAPLRYGAGVKGKVNMSMSRGQPVVGTPVAAEGMYAEHGRDMMICEDPAEFADAVIQLYQDESLWNALSVAGQQNVDNHFSFDAARQTLAQIFLDLEKRPVDVESGL